MSVALAVAIHLSSQPSPELAARTVTSCEAALGSDHCRLTDEPPDGEPFYAAVSSEGGDETRSVHILLLRRGDPLPVAERDLAFLPEDTPGDRWASVGVVIAALVAAEARVPEAPKAAPPPPPPRPPAPSGRVAPPPPPRAHVVRIDLLARLSRDTATDYPAELGPLLRGSFALGRSPFFVRVNAGYATRLVRQPSVAVPSCGLGAGFRWGAPEARWGAEASIVGLAERWILSASEPGRTDSRGVWRFGGALGVDGTWGATPHFQAVAGATLEYLSPRVTVDIQGKNAEKVPPVGAAVILGVRYVP